MSTRPMECGSCGLDHPSSEPCPATCTHEPDWRSVNLQYDGGTLYVDINCKHCGLSGCVGTQETLAEGVRW
jgi:hypothetical protein